MQLGYVHYAYLNDNGLRLRLRRGRASVSYQQRATASVSWSPNTSSTRTGDSSGTGERSHTSSRCCSRCIRAGQYYAGVGYDLHDLVDTGYWYWSTGVAFTWQDMQVDLLHIDTDSTARRLFESGQPLDGGA